MKNPQESLTLLGNAKTVYKDDYAPEVLEAFNNRHTENDYWVKFD
ncbi:MAG: preQ(1) synthase, partial [Bacteroidales bacterium]